MAILDTDRDLPSFPVESKVGDSRYRWFVDHYGRHCWELDALAPPVLRDRVESAILDLIDKDCWDHALQIESAEIESMSTVLGTFKSILMQASKYSGGGT